MYVKTAIVCAFAPISQSCMTTASPLPVWITNRSKSRTITTGAPKAAAIVLLGSLIPTTIVGHAFWKETDANARKMHQTQFLKNLALIAGLLMVLSEK